MNRPKGIAYALAACLIWGLIFVVPPQLMSSYSAIEVAIGRYTFYGVVSLLIFLFVKAKGECNYPLSIWIKALFFSLLSTMGYYNFVVLALHYSTPPICALVLGISPISIAFLGNWMEKECSYKSLLLPSLLIVIGLAIINVPQISETDALSEYVFGLVCSLLALLSWSYYVVINSRFLKHHPEVNPGHWSTLIGVTTLAWVAIFAGCFVIFTGDQFDLTKYTYLNPDFSSFLMGCAILGLICSWLGAFLWNRATLHLPVSLAGQLTLFETIFGVIFFYVLEMTLPPFLECLGILILLSAVLYGILPQKEYKISLN